MRCPACESALEQVKVAALALDRCPACGGYWLDDGELAALARGLSRLDAVPELSASVIFTKAAAPLRHPQRRCPRCDVLLQNFNYCYNSNILLDRCPRCRGVWVDAGELPAIAQYVKGNPRLDRLAESMADHVGRSEERKLFRDEVSALALGGLAGGWNPLAVLLVALAEWARKFRPEFTAPRKKPGAKRAPSGRPGARRQPS